MTYTMNYLYDEFTFTLDDVTVNQKFSCFTRTKETFENAQEKLDISGDILKVIYNLNNRIEELEDKVSSLERTIEGYE